jgi:hypothetical protein
MRRSALLPLALAPLALGASPLALALGSAALWSGTLAAGAAQAQVTAPAPAPAPTPAAPLAQVPADVPADAAAPLAPRVRAPAPPPPPPPPAPLTQAQTALGPEFSATISQRFEVDTNIDLEDPRPGTSAFTETRLALGLEEETPLQSFSGSFNAGLTFRQRRVDFTRDLVGTIGDDGVVTFPDDPAEDREGEATERRYDGNFGLALATDRPSSYAFSVAASRIDFTEEVGDLTPRTTVEGTGTWQLQFTPLIAGTLGLRGFYYDADNPQNTTIAENEITAGVVYDPTEVLRVTAGIGYFQRERRDTVVATGTRITEETSGASFRSSVRYAFDNFTVNGNLRVATAPGTRVSGDVNVAYPFLRGQVNARVFQNFAGGAGGDEIRVTGAGLGVLRDLDAVSRIRFDVAASRRVNIDDPADDDIDRIDFTTTYGYDLTETISADIGYRFRWREEGAETADSHALFVQIGRSFFTGF